MDGHFLHKARRLPKPIYRRRDRCPLVESPPYLLKDCPEDFVVIERPVRPFDAAGPFQILRLAKTSLDTEEAVTELARRLARPRSFFSYAGAKDRRAVTTQYVSARSSVLSAPRTWGHLTVEPAGFSAQPLGLGDLAGNEFRITVRRLKAGPQRHVTSIPNYFDEQRFSAQNYVAGKLLVRKRFAEAAALLAAGRGRAEADVARALAESLTDAVRALLRVPRKTLLMYLHAYQSHLFNRLLAARNAAAPHAEVRIREGPLYFPEAPLAPDELPLVGFGLALEGRSCRAEVEALLAAEGVAPRDFIVPQLPNLSVEGTWRATAAAVEGLAVGPLEPDERHDGFLKCRLSFFLKKGAYATVVVKALWA